MKTENPWRALRESLKLTQEEFADLLGIRQPTVSDWECGRHKPSRMAVKLMQQLKDKKEAQ